MLELLNNKQPEQVIVGSFNIPEELAKELSELLTKQSIREKLLLQLIEDPVKYEKAEEMLLPVVSKIEAIKIKITNEYVPAEYRSPKFIWNYDGWEVAGTSVNVLTIQ